MAPLLYQRLQFEEVTVETKLLIGCRWIQVGQGLHYDDTTSFFCTVHEQGPFFWGHPDSCGVILQVVDGWPDQCNSWLAGGPEDNYRAKYRCRLDQKHDGSHRCLDAGGGVIALWGTEYEMPESKAPK